MYIHSNDLQFSLISNYISFITNIPIFHIYIKIDIEGSVTLPAGGHHFENEFYLSTDEQLSDDDYKFTYAYDGTDHGEVTANFEYVFSGVSLVFMND